MRYYCVSLVSMKRKWALRSSVACMIVRYYCTFSHSTICLTTRPKPLPKRFFYIERSRGSSFKWDYPLLYLRSSSSFLRPFWEVNWFLYKTSADNLKSSADKEISVSFPTIAICTNLLHSHNYRHITDY